MISIVNYGMGNLKSLSNAFAFLGVDCRVVDAPAEILASRKLVLPGVGSFAQAMANIRALGIEDALNRAVRERGVPILGICLGMQLMAESGEEDGVTPGLGWFKGTVRRMPAGPGLKLPHVGFNAVTPCPDNSLIFRGLAGEVDFYFVHGYALSDCRAEEISSWTDYGGRFPSSVSRDNVFGTQFHPEKSQGNGLALLKNFTDLEL